MGRVLFWMFLACFGTQKLDGLPKHVLDVLTIFNGYFDNKQQIQEGGQDHDHVQVWITPVDVPAFLPNAALTVKEYNNGVVRIFNLAEVSDGAENNTVNLKLYNITGVSQHEAKDFDLEKLKTIKREDLQSTDDCVAVFAVVDRNYITVNYPYCQYTVNGKHPRFGVTFSCDMSIATFPMYTDQASPMAPYVDRLAGPRYPLINTPKDYVSPCGNWNTTTQ